MNYTALLHDKIRQYGLGGALFRAGKALVFKTYYALHTMFFYCCRYPAIHGLYLKYLIGFKYRHVEQYVGPTVEDMVSIEDALKERGENPEEYWVDLQDFEAFKARFLFPDTYAGGVNSGFRQEKLLEYYITYDLLGLQHFEKEDIYLDVAASSSPWAKVLREHRGIQAYALDLTPSEYSCFDYYKLENATATSFPDLSVQGLSLQCAYEMFMGDDDVALLEEISRILKVGGKAVIAPLYLHTHYCSWSSPEYWGKGYSDSAAKEYLWTKWRGIPSSRCYDAPVLQARILNKIACLGMSYTLYILINKEAISSEAYCHFILQLSK